jgi:hypothetical protein
METTRRIIESHEWEKLHMMRKTQGKERQNNKVKFYNGEEEVMEENE